MEEFFNRSVPLFLKNADNNDRRSSVRISVTNRLSSSGPHKELALRLTDDGDPFFLYSLILNEQDFQSLKSQQGLLVDFGSFPQKFVDLLELCLKEEHKDMPKFLLQFVSSPVGAFEQGIGNLNIIETNPFKHLTHLSLRFQPGNDSEVKKYLAGCLKSLKEEKCVLENRLATTEQDLRQRLENCQEVLSSKTRQLDTLQAEFSAKSSELTNRHAQELTQEKERVLQMKSITLQEFERERKEQEQSHRNIVMNLERRISEADAQIKKLTDRKYQDENTIRELRTKLSGLEGEYSHMKDELSSLRRGNAVLNSEQHDRDKTLAHLRTRLAVLEQELQDKQQVISRTNELLESANDQKRKLDSILENKQQEIKKLEKSIQSISSDVIKGNEIIQKLQFDRKAMRTKINFMEELTNKHRNIINEKGDELQKVNKENEKLNETVKQKDEEIKKTSDTLQATTEKLEESKQLLKTNENVINYLNRQMNDQMITGQQRHGTFELHSTKDPSLSRETLASVGISKSVTPPQAFVPQYSGSNTQITYRASSKQRKPAFPRPLTHSTPTIPEEDESRSPVSSSTPGSFTPNARITNENQPLLDPKYLTRKEQMAEVPLKQKENMPRENRVLKPLQRFGGNVKTGQPVQPPLMSAYFPKDS